MKKSWRIIVAAWVGSLVGCGAPSSEGELVGSSGESQVELHVITSGGFAAAYDLLAPRFEAETGITLNTSRGASGGGAPDSIPSRLDRGESFDVIILSRSALDGLTERGFVRPETRTDLVRSSIGMAVRQGAPVPDISTPEKLIQTMLAAKSIGYSASVSGTYLSTDLFPRIGLWERIDTKSTRIVGERVAAVVARGDVEIGFQQISEILPIEGAQYVGPIPDEYQRVTTFSTAITAQSSNAEVAQRLLDFLSSTEVAETISQTGLEPVVLETEQPAENANGPATAALDEVGYPDRPVTFVVALGVGGSALAGGCRHRATAAVTPTLLSPSPERSSSSTPCP